MKEKTLICGKYCKFSVYKSGHQSFFPLQKMIYHTHSITRHPTAIQSIIPLQAAWWASDYCVITRTFQNLEAFSCVFYFPAHSQFFLSSLPLKVCYYKTEIYGYSFETFHTKIAPGDGPYVHTYQLLLSFGRDVKGSCNNQWVKLCFWISEYLDICPNV